MATETLFSRLEQMIMVCSVKDKEDYREKRVEFTRLIQQAVQSSQESFEGTNVNVEQARSVVGVCQRALELSFELHGLSAEMLSDDGSIFTSKAAEKLIKEAKSILGALDRVSADHDITRAVTDNKQAKDELQRCVLILRTSILRAEVALEKNKMERYEVCIEEAKAALGTIKDDQLIKEKGFVKIQELKVELQEEHALQEKQYHEAKQEVKLLNLIQLFFSSSHSVDSLESEVALLIENLMLYNRLYATLDQNGLQKSILDFLYINFDIADEEHQKIIDSVETEVKQRLVQVLDDIDFLTEELKVKRAFARLHRPDKSIKTRLAMLSSSVKKAEERITKTRAELKHFEDKLESRVGLIEGFKCDMEMKSLHPRSSGNRASLIENETSEVSEAERESRDKLDAEYLKYLRTREGRLDDYLDTADKLNRTMEKVKCGTEFISRLRIISDFIKVREETTEQTALL